MPSAVFPLLSPRLAPPASPRQSAALAQSIKKDKAPRVRVLEYGAAPKKEEDVDSIEAAVAHIKATLPEMVATISSEAEIQPQLVGAMQNKKICMFIYTGALCRAGARAPRPRGAQRERETERRRAVQRVTDVATRAGPFGVPLSCPCRASVVPLSPLVPLCALHRQARRARPRHQAGHLDGRAV